MPVKEECDGCHSRKAAAIAAAEAAIAGAEERIRDADRRISICQDTAEILDPLARRLQAALQALRQVPHDLGEVYELIYAFIRRGGKMPRLGRWIEGDAGMNRRQDTGSRPGDADEEHRRPDELSLTEVARAVPTSSRWIRSQREALRCGLSCPDLAEVRSDFREHLRGWWKIHVNHASWGGEGRPPRGTSEPTRARVCKLAGMSESTYKACRRWWAARGYVAIVRPGWTPALRPGVLASAEDRNIRQAYVLCLPRRSKPVISPRTPAQTLSRPLSQSRRDLDRFPARKAPRQGTEKPDKTGAPRSSVLYRSPLAGLTDGWWAHITAPFAAWSASDVVWAVDHLPGGRQHRTRLACVRHSAGWLRWRLSHWLRDDGTPLPTPSQARAEAARQHRAYLAARRAEAARLAANRTADNDGNAARARDMLAAALGRPLPDKAARPDPAAAASRPRSAPGSLRRPGRAPARVSASLAAATARPAPPELPAWWTEAVAAAARVVAEQEAAESRAAARRNRSQPAHPAGSSGMTEVPSEGDVPHVTAAEPDDEWTENAA